jgi:hypothetical protein
MTARGAAHRKARSEQILLSAGFLCVVAASPFEFAGWFAYFSVDAPLRPQGRRMTTLRKR